MMENNKGRTENIGGIILGLGVYYTMLEMVPGWGLIGAILGLQGPPVVYYMIASLSGAVGGFLMGNGYCLPGMIGGFIGAIGAVLVGSYRLYHMESVYTLFLLFLTLVGSIPGILVFALLRFLQDSILGD